MCPMIELAGLTNKLPFIKNMVKNMTGGKLVSKLGHFALSYSGEELDAAHDQAERDGIELGAGGSGQ